MTREAFKFMNARVLDKRPFTRSEMFGPESVGRGAVPGFTRRVMVRLARNQKIVLVNDSSTRPTYKAIEVVKMNDEEISKYLRYSDEDEDLAPPPTNGAAAATDFDEEDPSEEASPGETPASTPSAAPSPTPSAASVVDDMDEPDVRRMLGSLISILPDIVKAINRIEKKVVAIESSQKALAETTARIEAGVTGQGEGTIRGDMNGLLELVYKMEKK